METAHIAILPSPGMGHLIPLAELAKRLIHYHYLSITFIIPTDGTLSKSARELLDDLPKNINSVVLPPANLDDLHDVKPLARISQTISRSLPSLREVFKVLSTTTRLTALVVDLFGTDSFDVAKEFKVSPYIFFPGAAMVLSWMLHMPTLDEMYSCEYKHLQNPVKLPGCIALHGRDLFYTIQDRKDESYTWFLHHCKRFGLAQGIMFNSFIDLETSAINALNEDNKNSKLPPIYPVGPLVQSGSNDGVDVNDCLKWLDDQPHRSVLFVSFGSGGALSPEQLLELAFGLESSGQRFLWVIRSPTRKAPNANFFDAQKQRMNAAMLVQDMKVALRPKVGEDGIVWREEISTVVKCLMEGEGGKRVRNKMREFKDAAAKALSVDGSSTLSLLQVTHKWRTQTTI
ncbi:hypothetical protein NE237_019430 [Protea cynaroides]|uniref:Uncharacterized protein n=1 Tax=Protea cynaroides TaxID=273540 RepID=A0A9Q0KC06_9MAGN|nr:hypothetical protein NE237_019430 [Protea cynaroides]